MTPKVKSALEKWLEEKDYLICGFDGNPIPFDKWPEVFRNAVWIEFFYENNVFIVVHTRPPFDYYEIQSDGWADVSKVYKSKREATAAAIQAASLILEDRL